MEFEITGQLLEATKHLVEAEMQAFADKEPDKSLHDQLMWGVGAGTYFNNFDSRLPGGFLRDMMVRSSFMDDKGEPDPPRSDLRNSQTPREFFAVIDKSIEDEGLDPNEIERLVKGIRNSPEVPIALSKYVFPVYVRLRAIGYSHFDLRV